MPMQASWFLSLVRPAPSITDPIERQQAYIFSALMLVLSVLLALGTWFWMQTARDQTPALWGLFIFTNVYCWAMYGVCRLGHYRTAARLYALLAYTSIIGGYVAFGYTQPEAVFIYLALVIIIVGLALSLRETMLVVVIISGTMLVLPVAMQTDAVHTLTLWNIGLFTLVIGLVTLLTVMITRIYRTQAYENEQRYRELMEANNEGVLVVDADTARILDTNTAFERITGYQVSQIIGRYPIEFLTATSQQVSARIWEQRSPDTHEFEGRRADGASFIVEATLKPYSYRQQSAYVIIVQDIAEHKVTEKALYLSEQRFKAIFNNTFQLMGLLEPDGKIIEMNQTALNFFNATAHDIRGLYLWDSLMWRENADARALVQRHVREAAAGRFMRFEIDLHGAETHHITADFSITPVYDERGKVTLLIPEARDITQRKQAERKRREIERRYQALFDQTADAVFIFSMQGELLEVNQQALNMLNCERADIIGMDLTRFIAAEEHDQTYDVLARLQRGELISKVYERRMRRKTGETFLAELSAQLVRDDNGDPLYIQSMARDLTDRQKAERDRFHLALQREHTKMLESFIEQASHHFRTPLSNIKTSAYLLSRLIDRPQKQAEHTQVVHQEIERLESLIEDLLTVTRLRKDDSSYNITRVAIKSLLHEIRAYTQGRIAYNHFTWDWTHETTLDPVVIGDKTRLGRAIQNVVDNAMMYTTAGGTIRVSNHVYNRWFVIDIQDTGMGIDPRDLPYIFDNFYRAEAARERETTSSGLGLAITKQIIDRHRGDVRVQSTRARGTRVQIILPIQLDWHTEPPPLPAGLLELDAPEDHSHRGDLL